jgi:hypothetical protein
VAAAYERDRKVRSSQEGKSRCRHARAVWPFNQASPVLGCTLSTIPSCSDSAPRQKLLEQDQVPGAFPEAIRPDAKVRYGGNKQRAAGKPNYVHVEADLRTRTNTLMISFRLQMKEQLSFDNKQILRELHNCPLSSVLRTGLPLKGTN